MGVLAGVAALGVPVGVLLAGDTAGLLGVIVMVVPRLPGPPEALLMEKRGGDGDEDGDAVHGEDDDGELCSGGFGVELVLRALIVNDGGLRGTFCWDCGNLGLVDACVSLKMSGRLASLTSGSSTRLFSILVCTFLSVWEPHPASGSLSCSRST